MKLATICVFGSAFGTFVLAAEVKLKVSDLPSAVQTAAKKQGNGAKIVGASKEQEHGHVEYEVETKVDSKTRDLVFAEDGRLLEIEEEVDLINVPEAARRTIQERAGGGTIRKVESVKRGASVSYEAAVTLNGRNTEVAVEADGNPHKNK